MLNIVVCASGGGGNLLNLLKSSEFNKSYAISNVLVDRPCGAIDVANEHQIPCLKAFDVAGRLLHAFPFPITSKRPALST